jgi:asparagine synthase (glutamine-hydrolysing)
LFLARDFFGMKPLYYVRPADAGGVFAFASEIKALLDWLPLKRTVHAQRLYEYLRWGCTDHGGDTLFEHVRQLPSAHYLEVPLDRPDRLEPVRYWHPPEDVLHDISFDEAARQVRELFLKNIHLHLRSDVPVGAALSGGVDSSSIVAGMRVVDADADIHAFSYIAEDPAISEERWVDLVVARAGAVVHKVRPAPGELIADLDRLIYTQDEPFGSTSMYAQYCVFRAAAREGIKVMLDGQGADEMLAGYGQYAPARLSTLLKRGRFLAAARFAGRAAALSGGRIKLWLHAARLLLPALGKKLVGRWLMPAWLDGAWFQNHGVALFPATAPRQHEGLHAELRQTLIATSLPQLLRYEDRNSMASSIESRLPFLTPALAEFLLRLPEDFLLGRDGMTKSVFRQAMRGIVPDAILDRRDKIGFATPERTWLTTLRPWVETALASERARSIAALNGPALTRDWQAIIAGRAKFDFRVWRWVNLIRWADCFDVVFPS